MMHVFDGFLLSFVQEQCTIYLYKQICDIEILESAYGA